MQNLFPPELRWLFPKVKPQLLFHMASFFCVTVSSLLGLVTPFSIRWLIDSILPSHDLPLLIVAIGLIFASYEGRAVFSALGGYLTFRATQGTALSLRLSLLRHIGSLSADYFDRTPVGELLYPFERPIDEISYFGSDLLPSILRTAVSAAATLSAMAVLSPKLTFVVVPLLPAFLALRHCYRTRIGHQADLVQTARNKFSSFLGEHLSALTEIQLLGQTEPREREASELLTKAIGRQDILYRTGSFFSAFSNLAIVSGMAAVLACGSLMVFDGQLTTGTLIAFYGLVIQLFEPLSTATETYARAQRAFSSIRQIQRVFAIAPAVEEHRHAKPIPSGVPLHVTFRNVSFGYPGNGDVIRIPSLEIREGERIAIIGPNGAGKSTVGKLLSRLYDARSGEVLIAGSDVRAITRASLRSAVWYLPAQPVLFHRSIADNLRIGRPQSTPGEMEQVLRIVKLTKYLDRCPDSLDDYLEPNGSNLSSGERQRVAIARALLHRPRILILDETTSSLDPDSEQAILRAIGQTLPDSTLLVVSHRWPTMEWTGRILRMRQGQIVGDGESRAFFLTQESGGKFS